MSENLPVRVKFFRRSIQQMIDSETMPSNDLLRSLLVEDERLAEWERRTGTAPQRPKADPKEVHSCHADCPCQSGGEPLRDFVAPVPHTEGEKERPGVCVEHGTWNINECEYGQCPQCGDKLVPGPFPYAKAFRERVCPVPEFPAWNPQPGDAIKKEES